MGLRSIARAVSVAAIVGIVGATAACDSQMNQGGPASIAGQPPAASLNASQTASQTGRPPTPALANPTAAPPPPAVTHPTAEPTITITPPQSATTNIASVNATSIFEVGVTAGAFCADVGARGITKGNVRVACTRSPTDNRLRWRP